MTLIVLALLLAVALLAAPVFLAYRRLGFEQALVALAMGLILSGLAGLRAPFMSTAPLLAVTVGLLAASSLWIAILPEGFDALVRRGTASRGAETVLLALLCTVAPLGNLEWAARVASDLGWVEAHAPMQTRRRSGIEDWREYHVTSDSMREPDPVTFWRSKRGVPPFNEDGFKVPFELEVPKPEGLFRVIAYGDSNTEGPPRGGWPALLGRRLARHDTTSRRYEVVNAGVSGYSSYQGLQRFLEEKDVYEPDLVLVSFGWNDLPEAVDAPDHEYRPHSRAVVALLRLLVHSRAFQVIQHRMLAEGHAGRMKDAPSRVPLANYLDNMDRFAEEAHRSGAEVVFLTRPHRARVSELLDMAPSWRAKVPIYNDTLRDLAERHGWILIDVERYFEEKDGALFGDETHFTEEGRREMADLIVAGLLEHELL